VRKVTIHCEGGEVLRRHLTSNFEGSPFALVTDRDLPAEVRRELNSGFDSGIFISEPDDSMYALSWRAVIF
jgi:hypothetical protein